MQTIIYIVGPTAIGKTALAFRIAKKLNSELVNADSVQVYGGLDIISGKDKPQNSTIPIHLLDAVSPTESFSVSQFQKLGEDVIDQILLKNKIPVVVGGTGLYVKSLIDGIPTKDIPYDKNLRLELENLSVDELQKKLSKKRLLQMNESDSKNKRRLIRAIEIEKSAFQKFITTIPFPTTQHLQIGLRAGREIIKERISKRVDVRVKNGALDEARGLFKDYKNLTVQVKNTNGYKQLFQYLNKELTFDEAVEKWKISEHQLAKNQMTWFGKDKRIKWFDITKRGFEADINKEIERFLI